jgi:hypothetical protein
MPHTKRLYAEIEEPETAEAFARLSESQKATHETQERFLAGYATGGTTSKGLRAAQPLSRRTVENWRQHDYMGFRARQTMAFRAFCDGLEDKAMELVGDLKVTNSPLLLLALLNANLPEKYRTGAIMSDDTAKDLLASIKELRKTQKVRQPVAMLEDDGDAVDQAERMLSEGR